VQTFLTKVRTTIKEHKQITAGKLIWLLNPLTGLGALSSACGE
jgi:hypothetical protein